MQDAVEMRQVHGNKIVFVTKKDIGKAVECDGLITNDPEVTLAVKASDCLPIFFNDPITNSIGVVHAGWRGLENGIIKNAVRRFGSLSAGRLIVYIGPHICQKHYEVKTDVSGKFQKYKNAIRKVRSKEFLDLAEVAVRQLIESGVKKENITIDRTCTFEDRNFYSYRRGDKNERNIFLLTPPGK